MARVPYEQRSVLLALETYLTTKGWNNITYSDSYQSDETITNPQVTVTFPPSSMVELQLGKVENGDKLFSRRILVNAYMESERRAQNMADDIMDFMDETCVDIVDPSGTTLGYIICSNTEAIRAETFAPILNQPKLLRYRAAVQGPFDAFYPGT